MKTEFETQILDIDEKETKAKLKKIGAVAQPAELNRRWVFDIRPDHSHQWIRLRTNGKKTTLCYKKRNDNSVTGTEELEVIVDDFEKTYEMISKLDFYFDKYYQENQSQIFVLDDIEFKIDKWPMIPTLLEIEAKSKKSVEKGLKLLGFYGKDFGHQGHVKIFRQYGIDLHNFKELKF